MAVSVLNTAIIFFVFYLLVAILLSGWSHLFFWFLVTPALFLGYLELFPVCWQLQAWLSPSCSATNLEHCENQDTYPSIHSPSDTCGSDLLVLWSIWISNSQRTLYISFFIIDSGFYLYNITYYSQNIITCTILSKSPFLPSLCIHFKLICYICLFMQLIVSSLFLHNWYLLCFIL